MDKHCVSLEIAKQLKEAGWKKPTIYQWSDNYYGVLTFGKPAEIFKGEYRIVDSPVMLDDTEYPAPLATEIFEELPCKNIYIRYYDLLGIDEWGVDLQTSTGLETRDKFLPNALAKMWLYLKREA